MAGADRPTPLWDIARLFLKLGTTAFGGPAAHIAMLQHEVVERRAWITQAEFLDHLGASNLIPGPTSTELVIHIGRKRGGWPGLLVAGTCFILPAALMVGILAWAYVRYGSLPAVSGLLYGVKPVVIAIILQALWKLGRTAVKSLWLAVVGVLALGLSTFGVSPLLVLIAGGILALASVLHRSRAKAALLLPLNLPPLAPAAATFASAGLWPIFLIFVKIGAMVFGSGYVLLVFLRADLVERHPWLTQQQLLDAVAVGQITPGPVFTTATFLGYLLHGTSGAIAATVGIFLPGFVFVAISAPLIPKIRQSRIAGAALDGINVASLALMAVVTWQLARSALVDWTTVALLLGSAALLFRFPRLNSAWLIGGAGLAGALRYALW
ncbi:MAG TPA: chromate efflux transporter [Candidatus Eisenbacteria bacterium]|nr:chromate efflux transporter [Candidatus Eisenbacteria bacterium]